MTEHFTNQLLAWYQNYGRKHLPWQQDKSPYPIWISEIMLQQTQVATVIPYYIKFMQQYPNIQSLAKAPIDEVLHLWTGLGYYARARNLHKAAQIITNEYAGIFPKNIEELIDLPGIGRSTAGAILSFAHNDYHPILDGNVKRVLTRFFAIEGWPGHKKIENKLWDLALSLTPKHNAAAYNQAIMDLGSSLCSRSKFQCTLCPVNKDCQAFAKGQQKRFPNSKSKSQKPTKQAYLLVQESLESSQLRVLLEKRPPSGIWGGLWCFPQFNNLEALQAQCSDADLLKPLHTFRHTFSHYHLEVIPYSYTGPLKQSNAVMEDKPVLWYNLQTPSKVGLAAATVKILKQINNRG